MIKNIIFDLAGVVLNLNLERDTKALNAAGLPDFENCLKNKELVKPLMAYLNGLVSVEVFLKTIRPFCRPDATDEEILYAMDAVLDDIPASRLELIKQLGEKYRVFLLSNIYDSAWQHTVREMKRQGYEVSDCFEKAFLSCEMMLAKPDPAIFKQVVKETGIVPEETVFVDDTRSNVLAANELGFNSYVVEMNKLEDTICRLKEQGILE